MVSWIINNYIEESLKAENHAIPCKDVIVCLRDGEILRKVFIDNILKLTNSQNRAERNV